MKNTLITLLATLCLTGCSKSLFPKEISEADMKVFGEGSSYFNKELTGDYYLVVGQHLQKEDGTFPTEFDCVLITKDEDEYKVGFYRNLGDQFRRIDQPVVVTGTYGAHVSANNEFNVPCIQAVKKDGTETNQIFVLKGKVTHQISTTIK